MVQLTQQEIYLDNMNRILKRPMFRIGGSAGTGITSGLDKSRAQYAEGTTLERLQKATGAVPNNRNLSQFLTTFGLDLLSRPPSGGFFSTVAQAAQQPTQTLFDNFNRERDFQRQLALTATQSDIEFEREKELAEIERKNKIEANQRKARSMAETEGSGFFGDYEGAFKAVTDREIYGPLDKPGEVRLKNIENTTAQLQDAAKPYGGLNPIDAENRATFFVDFNKTLRENDDLSNDNFDLTTPESPFWSQSRDPKEYREGLIYYDPISKRYFERDMDAEPQPNVPPGFSVREVR